ncbi:MAG TPA: universal stress protein [Thermodesulforhabdus norvegica]|uniref:Universal stress protein n=1 Tax=Thermodesulforhabdus norvegica TaxID=39841 RepID=A0A7C0WUV6_9BACT|nr:universal stress protein [Deltaproteobacteria bacterium]MBW2068734.1 universal stress protein [Deltaproteobacteria bacterium]HDL90232.1 universal stress protein [Thermodesulforhabdus norvegica]
MVRTLVAVSPDIESSIALRLACELAHFCEMSIQAIYAKEPEVPGGYTDFGWARRTWERTLIEKFEREISQLIKTEERFCPVTIQPIVTTSERDKAVLERLRTGEYDLFVEGALSPEMEVVKERLDSKLYQNAPVPVVLVRNLMKVDRVMVVLDRDFLSDQVSEVLKSLFEKKDLQMDVCFLKAEVGDNAATIEALRSLGFSVRNVYRYPGSELPSEYPLIITEFNRHKGYSESYFRVLENVNASVLFAWSE